MCIFRGSLHVVCPHSFWVAVGPKWEREVNYLPFRSSRIVSPLYALRIQ